MDASDEDSDRIPDGTGDQSGRAPGGEGPSSSDFLGRLQPGAPAEELATEVLRARLQEEESPLLALYDLGVLSEQLRAGSTRGGETRAEKAREAAGLLAKRLAPDSGSSDSVSSGPSASTSAGTDSAGKDSAGPEGNADADRKQTRASPGDPGPEGAGEKPQGSSVGAPSVGVSSAGVPSEDAPAEDVSTGETSKEDPSNGTPGYFYAEIEKAGYEGATATEAKGPGEAYHQVAGTFVKESGGAVSPEDVEAHVRLFLFTGESFEEKRAKIGQEGGNLDSPSRDSEWDPATDPDFQRIDASAAADQMLSRSGQ